MVSEVMIKSGLMVSGEKRMPLLERLVLVSGLRYLLCHW